MPEHGKDFREVIEETAARKVRAGQVRFGGGTPSSEAPRDVYAAACQSIGTALVGDNYTYAKSGPKFTRKSKDFIFQISFQSSPHNIGGELVALWIHANVMSPTLDKWRKTHHSLLKSAGVAGGQIGNLLSKPSWMEWNLAPLVTRDEQIADAVATIRRIIFPYFGMFDDIPSLLAGLTVAPIPSFWPASSLDFIMCFGSHSDAYLAAINMLRFLPEAEKRYPAALAGFRANGLPSHTPSIHGELLAAATIVYGFSDLAGSIAHGK